MYDIFKPRFLQHSFAPRILIGGGSDTTAIDTVAREAAEAAQQSVDAITAQVGETIQADQGVISSDGLLLVNGTGLDIVLTGTTSLDLIGDGLTEASNGPAPGSVTATELADGAVSNDKLATMAAVTLKGNDGASAAAPKDLTPSEVANLLPIASSSQAGLMSASDKVKSDLAHFNFDTVAQMVASTDLQLGSLVEVGGYYQKGDGGGNWFEVVAAGTGTHDGGGVIDLSGTGLQAIGLFANGCYFEQWGTVKDGATDDAPAIRAALAWCYSNGVSSILAYNGQGTFGVSGLIHLPENIVLDFQNCSMIPLSSDAGINLRYYTGLKNLIWNANNSPAWVGPMLLVDAYTDSNIARYPDVKNVSCRGYNGDPNGDVVGTMIRLDASTGTRITGFRASGLYAANLDTVVEFLPSDSALQGYINSNFLEFDMIYNCRRCFDLDRLATDNAIDQNYIRMSYQVGTTTQEPVMVCNGKYNEFDFLVWDWVRNDAPVTVEFGDNSKGNTVAGSVSPLAVKDASHSDARNKITSRIRPITSFSGHAMEPAASNTGLFLGQVDNCLAFGHKRYSITAPTPDSGSINSAFLPNQTSRPQWNALTSLQVEIDLLESKENLRTIGVTFSDGMVPDFVTFEHSADGVTWTEVDTLPGSRVTAWTGMSYTGGLFQYLRFTVTSAVAIDYKITQFFAWWKKETQGAYLPTGGGKLWGNAEFMAGNAVAFTSANGAGTAQINVDNSNRLQLVASGGVELNGVRILGDQQPAISDPTGGTVVDTECRAALIALADSIRNHGLIGI